jgi:hypothetical protein
MRTKGLAGVAALAAALAVTACGGGGSSSSSSSGASVTAFCEKGNEYQQLVRSFQTTATNDFSTLKSAVQQAEAKMQEVDDVAPAAVKSSADQALASLKDFSSLLQGVNSPQDLRGSAAKIKSDVGSLVSAVGGLKSYAREHCNS